MKTGKKVLVVVFVFCSLAMSACISAFAEPVTDAAEATQPEKPVESVSPQVLESVREASAAFRFCFKTDEDIYELFEKHFSNYNVSDYSRFFLNIPSSSIVIFFVPNDCNFSGTASALSFTKPCLKLTYAFTTKSYATSVVPVTTYFSSGNTTFRNFDVALKDSNSVLLAENIEYFYAVNVDATMSLDSTNDYLATIVNRLDMVYTVQLVLIGLSVGLVVCVLLYKFLRSAF